MRRTYYSPVFAATLLSLVACGKNDSSTSQLSAVEAGAVAVKVNLKTTVAGQFMRAENGGGSTVNANSAAALTWEAFDIIDRNGGSLVSGDPVFIRTLNGNYLQVVGGNTTTLNTASPNAGTHEAFTVEKVGGGTITNGSVIAFKSSATNRYIMAANGGGSSVSVSGAALGAWESFGVSIRGSAPFATTPFNFPNGLIVELKARHSSKCADVSLASTANGALIQQYSCNNTNAQRFRLQAEGSGYKLVNVNSGKCLDVKNASTADGAPVYQWDCVNVAHQRAKFYPTASGGYSIRFEHSNKCLDVSGVSVADAAALHQWTCGNHANQDFTITAKNASTAATPPATTPPPSGTPSPIVPPTKRVVYGPLGLTQGGYATISRAVFPGTCEKGAIKPTTGALFPFNEPQTLVVRGPLILSDLVVYQRQSNGDWKSISQLSTMQWMENNFGVIANLGTYPKVNTTLENGREFFTSFPSGGEIIVLFRARMPYPTTGPYNSVAQNDVPAVWLLNSNIFKAPSAQYFCNCRGLGNPGGCGEIDIAEIIPGNRDEITTTLYTYEGARGAILSPRPVNNFRIYGAVLRVNNGQGEVSIMEVDAFDFSRTTLPGSYVANEWLPAAQRLNVGQESLIKP